MTYRSLKNSSWSTSIDDDLRTAYDCPSIPMILVILHPKAGFWNGQAMGQSDEVHRALMGILGTQRRILVSVLLELIR